MSNNFFADLLDTELAEKTLTYRGKSKQVFFKPLTAGESLALLKGQAVPFTIGADGQPTGGGVVSFDLYDNREKQLKALAFRLCDEKGKAVFRNLNDLSSQPLDLINALLELLGEVNAEQKEDLGKS